MTSLLFVHRLLITMAVILCAGFAVRELVIALRSGDGMATFLALAFGAAAAVLIAYLRWLLRQRDRFRASPPGPGTSP